jgi:hypothetical protein
MALFLAGALALAALAIAVTEERQYRAHRRFCATAARAEGLVSRLGLRRHLSRNAPRSSDHVHRVPVVRFRASDGVEYEFDSEDAPREVGAKVDVAYSAEVPSTAYVVRTRRNFGCALIVLAAAIAALVAGLIR